MWGQKIQNAVLGTKNYYSFKSKNNSKSVSILLRSQTVFFKCNICDELVVICQLLHRLNNNYTTGLGK